VPYPHFDVPLAGGSLLVAAVAILHVFLAHGAVGGGIVAAFLHAKAVRENDALLLDFLRSIAHVLVLGPLIAGAVTGVGIWFTISVVSPETTELLIHQFVFAWAIEWVAFAVEIAAAYVWAYGFERGLEPRAHVAVARLYAGASWVSLLVINHILSFMLSPGEWERTGTFADAFWNPVSFPADVLRTISALSIGAIFVIVVAAFGRRPREETTRLVNEAARFLLPLALMAPAAAWFFAATPETARHLVLGGAIAPTLFFTFGLVASTLVGGYAYHALIRERRLVSRETALLLAGIAFVATGAGEFVREGMRKPYLVYGHVWSNGLRPALRDRYAAEGVLAAVPYAIPPGRSWAEATDEERGAWVFDAECRRCHTVDGMNGIAPLVAGWRRDLIDIATARLDELKPFMPPFVGTEEERRALVAYLETLARRGDRARPPEAPR
jgi:cytochrome bd-type quinol oxidase subunit 1